jgi:hypothetical protein
MSGSGHVARVGEKCVRSMVRKYEGKKPVGRPSRRYVDRRKNERKRMGFCGLDSSGCAGELMIGCCEHGDEPSGSMK